MYKVSLASHSRALRVVISATVAIAVAGLLTLGVAAPADASAPFVLKLTNKAGAALSGYDVYPVQVDSSGDPTYWQNPDPATPESGHAGFYDMSLVDGATYALSISPNGAALNSSTTQYLGGGQSVLGAETFTPSASDHFLAASVATGATIKGTMSGPTGGTLGNGYVEIYLYNGSVWTNVAFTKANSHGQYTFANAVPGSYKLAFSAPGDRFPITFSGGAATLDAATPTYVAVGSTATVNQRMLTGTGSITGSDDIEFVGFGSEPLKGATPVAFPVTAFSGSQATKIDLDHAIYGAASSGSGAWTISNLPAGPYVVLIEPIYNNEAQQWVGTTDPHLSFDDPSTTIFTVTAGHKVSSPRGSLWAQYGNPGGDGSSAPIIVEDATTHVGLAKDYVTVSSDFYAYGTVSGTTGVGGGVPLQYGNGDDLNASLQPGFYTVTVVDPSGLHEPFSQSRYMEFAVDETPIYVYLQPTGVVPAVSAGAGIANTATAIGSQYSITAIPARSDAAVTFQWLRNGTPIFGANQATGNTSTYTAQSADFGTHLSVRVKAASWGYAPVYAYADVASPLSVETVGPAPTNTSLPSISPATNVHVGTVLQANAGTWDTAGLHFDYVWKADGAPIGGAADSSTYTVSEPDLTAGSSISVSVTPSEPGYDAATAVDSSNTVTPVVQAAPTLLKAPVVSKKTSGHNTIYSTTAGTWSVPGETISYSWQDLLDPSSPLELSSSSSMSTPTIPADAGEITLTVTAKKDGYVDATKQLIVRKGTTPYLVETAPVVADQTSGPTITDPTALVKVGDVLAVTPGTYTNADQPSVAPNSIKEQWMRQVGTHAPVPIAGATGPTYTVVAADVNARLSIAETAVSLGEPNGSSTAPAGTGTTGTALVTSVPSVVINGVTAGGHTLTAGVGAWPVSGVTNSYQWFYCPDSTCDESVIGQYLPIPKATKSSIVVNAAWDTLYVRVTGTKSGFAPGVAHSASVAVGDTVNIQTLSEPVIKGLVGGLARTGVKLTVTPGAYSTSAVHRSYVWETEDCDPGSCDPATWAPAHGVGASTSTFTPDGTDWGAGNTSIRVLETVDGAASGHSSLGSGASTEASMTLGTLTVLKKPTVRVLPDQFDIVDAQFAPTGGSTGGVAYGWSFGVFSSGGASLQRSLITPTEAVSGGVTYYGYQGYNDVSFTLIQQVGSAPTVTPGSISGNTWGTPLVAPDPSAVFTYPESLATAVAYQWYLGTTAIKGATSSSYSPPTSYVGKKITVKETSSSYGFHKTATYTASYVTLVAAPITGIGNPGMNFTGPLQPGTIVTAAPDVIDYPAGTTFTYQWQHNAGSGFVAISGATKSTYTVQPSDVGDQLRFVVTGAHAGYLPSVTPSLVDTVLIVSNLATITPPVITGTPKVGGALTVSTGLWNATGLAYRYQWYRNGVALPGATAATYTPIATSSGDELSVVVTATRAGFLTATSTSNTVIVTVGDAPVVVKSPVVTVSGTTYTVSPGSWSLDGLTLSYDWQLNGSDIVGSTNSYQQTIAGPGTVSVIITASRDGYTSKVVEVVAP